MYSGDELYSDEITSGPYAEDEEVSFEGWMKEVDQIISTATGMSIHDLPDMQFRDAYDNDDTPEEFCIDQLGIEDGMLVDKELFTETTGL